MKSQRAVREGCLFCRIARGETAAEIVLESETSLAFLDHRPLFPGHCLLVPKAHCETLADLPAAAVGPLFSDAQRLARAVESAMAAEGSFVALNNRVSQSVPHLHVHVVPRRRKDGLRGFFWPRQKYESDGLMRGVGERIRAALQTPGTEGPVGNRPDEG
jgi:histidine triad (HIT) family protein